MCPKASNLHEYEKGVSNLENAIRNSSDYSVEEERLVSVLDLLENNVTDKEIPLLIKPLEFLGGPVVPPAIVHTIGTIGSSKAFDVVLQILRECFEDGRSEETTANECVRVLDELDAERAEREGVEDIVESNWF